METLERCHRALLEGGPRKIRVGIVGISGYGGGVYTSGAFYARVE